MCCKTHVQITPLPAHNYSRRPVSEDYIVQAESMQHSFARMIIIEVVRMPFSHQDRMHHVSDEQWPWGHLYIPVGLYACGLLPKYFYG